MTAKTFKTTIYRDGSMCFIPIAFDPRAVFGKVRAPVVVTFNGYSYRSTIATMGGVVCIPLRKSNREAQLHPSARARRCDRGGQKARDPRAARARCGRVHRRASAQEEEIAMSQPRTRTAARGVRSASKAAPRPGPTKRASGANAYVALLRGINVGGNNMLPMKDLAAMFDKAGCSEVKTYIQSGNVVFYADAAVAARIPDVIAKAIAARSKMKIPVVVRASTARTATGVPSSPTPISTPSSARRARCETGAPC